MHVWWRTCTKLSGRTRVNWGRVAIRKAIAGLLGISPFLLMERENRETRCQIIKANRPRGVANIGKHGVFLIMGEKIPIRETLGPGCGLLSCMCPQEQQLHHLGAEQLNSRSRVRAAGHPWQPPQLFSVYERELLLFTLRQWPPH